MKTILFFCLSLLAFMTSAGKTHHPPDYTRHLTGVYTMTYMNWNGDIARMPEPGFSGFIRMTRRDTTHLDMTFSVKARGNGRSINETSDPQTVEVRPHAGNVFYLYDKGVKLGTISPTAVTIRTATEDGKGLLIIKAGRYSSYKVGS